MTTILPTDRPIRYAVTTDDGPLVGMTHVGELTGVNPALSVVADADPLAFVAALPAALFPELPTSGWLEADVIYRYGDGAVIVRQSHYRTEHAPADVPALFIVYREDAEDLEWVVGERVEIGMRRTYDGVLYRCIQAHVVDSPQWTPVATLGVLWERVPDEPPPAPTWIDSGARVTSLIGAGVIGVTTTAPFSAGLAIRIKQIEASVTRIHQAGAPGILVISPHIAVTGGEVVEVRG